MLASLGQDATGEAMVQPLAISQTSPPARDWPIAAWLLLCCAMIFAMVVLGGVTRLTHAGLSMVEWRPLIGVLPPLSETQWQTVFAKYQQHPEYQQLNDAMTLMEFKSIFWMEYAHRMWGRAIALTFLVPFVYFLIRGRLAGTLKAKLIVIFVLGGLQGLLGWYLVESGLADDPDVSPYRLTGHLGAAFLIYGYTLWVALGLIFPAREGGVSAARRPLRRFAAGLVGLVFVTVLSGGFVAGLDAGLAYNTFPLMDGRLIPADVLELEPRNFFENIATVQFDHRVLALAAALAVVAFWVRARSAALAPRALFAVHALLAAAAVQLSLGIWTLLLIVPVPLAAAHQAGALILFTVALWVTHELGAARTPAVKR